MSATEIWEVVKQFEIRNAGTNKSSAAQCLLGKILKIKLDAASLPTDFQFHWEITEKLGGAQKSARSAKTLDDAEKDMLAAARAL